MRNVTILEKHGKYILPDKVKFHQLLKKHNTGKISYERRPSGRLSALNNTGLDVFSQPS